MRKALFIVIPALLGTPPADAADAHALVMRAYAAPPEQFVLKDTDNAPFGKGIELVIVREDIRFTIDYEWWVGGIEVYERPDGTGGLRSLSCYRDINADGLVDYGTRGRCVRVPLIAYDPDDPSTDFHGREYWQERYETALFALSGSLGGRLASLAP